MGRGSISSSPSRVIFGKYDHFKHLSAQHNIGKSNSTKDIYYIYNGKKKRRFMFSKIRGKVSVSFTKRSFYENDTIFLCRTYYFYYNIYVV